MNIAEMIRVLAGKGMGMQVVAGKVKTVNEDKRHCIVQPIDTNLPEIKGVRLIADGSKGILITPKQGSVVLVVMITEVDGFVAMFSEIDQMEIISENSNLKAKILEQSTEISIGDVNINTDGSALSINTNGDLVIDAGGGNVLKIGNENYSITTALLDIIDILINLTVSTGTGPSGPPINMSDILIVQNNLKSLFNQQ